jgi:hypothetical protein
MLVEENNHKKRRVRSNILRVSKAAVKAIIVYVVYVVVVRLLAPISMIFPDFQQIIAAFVAVYIVLMVAGDLASGTIFQHLLYAVKSSFVIAYLMFTLNTGIFDYTVGNTNLIIDLRLFLVIVMFLGLLGLAKSMLQAINYLNEKSETAHI